jgi:hypothetical protein
MGYSICGFFILEERKASSPYIRIPTRALFLSAVPLLVIYLWIGGGQFATDVSVIESEMVFSSQWIQENTPTEAIIAAHDIGALGFWGYRRIVDLGGLTELNSILLLQGHLSLKDYLNQTHADYLMTFPIYYANVLKDCEPIMQTINPNQTEPLGYAMTIYEWQNGCRTRLAE